MLLFLAIFPPLFIIYLIYKLDKYEKEPLEIIVKVFILGCLTVIPVLLFEGIAKGIFEVGLIDSILSATGSGLLGSDNIQLLLYVVFGIAIIEEYFKYLVLTRYAYKREAFNEPMDGIVYGVVASLGFALI
ncbi:MAG: PrsW family intramembrane metalloprotease [Pelagibacterales bacterium]|nr:PrsW family intramembrane metalloprotease [Pelagibacterales bacterium]